jgi:peptidoglycan glycosyltransferase
VNRALRRISIAVLVMFVVLLINVNYLQGFEPASLATEPGNSRALSAAQNQYERGSIVTSDSVTIAASKASTSPNDSIKYQRYYPSGPAYASVTGYDTLYSQTGIEAAENSLLSGNDSALDVRKIIDLITGKTTKGATVTVTINSKAQNAAYAALAASGKAGGVVAIDPSTGKILALVSYPSFDPGVLATHDGTQLIKSDNQLLTDKTQPLLNRALQGTYPPGSTFKIVTSSALLTQNPSTTTNTSFASPTTLTFQQSSHPLTNDLGEVCSPTGQATLIYAFAKSCDTTFGKIGEDVGASALNAMATKFGMNNPNLAIPLPVAQSNYVIPPSLPLTAYSAIGQYSDTVTPLQEAMFAAAIANGGTLMKPYLVQQVTASDLSTVNVTLPTVLSQPVSATVASDLKSMMIAVVQQPEGTAYGFRTAVTGLQLAGKTGTAETGTVTGLDDAVFTCFAPYDNPKIAVGVIIQGGGYGATSAAPIAVKVIQAYLAFLGNQ